MNKVSQCDSTAEWLEELIGIDLMQNDNFLDTFCEHCGAQFRDCGQPDCPAGFDPWGSDDCRREELRRDIDGAVSRCAEEIAVAFDHWGCLRY